MGNISKKTVLCNMLDRLNMSSYKCLLTDHYAKKLTVGAAVTLFVEGQFQTRTTLDDIVLNLDTHPELQERVGFSTINPSSLNRKLEDIPLPVLESLFSHLASELKSRKKHAKGIGLLGKLSPIDSTTITLPALLGDWAYYQKHKNGVKIHTRLLSLEPGCHFPDEVVLSTMGVSDQKAVNQLVVSQDTTYILDRGYVNHKNFKTWVDESIFFVARLRVNPQHTVLQERSIHSESYIILDADVEMMVPSTKERFIARLIQFTDSNGNLYSILTNRYDLSAEDIGEIYRCRWQVELFFKWMKQHLKTVKFHNHKPHAVWVQIYIGLITYLLSRLIFDEHPCTCTYWNFIKTLRHYADLNWEEFITRMNRAPSRTSRGRQKREDTVPKPQVTGKRETVKFIVK